MSNTRDEVRYREVAPLGSGGMATVTLAEDTMLGRRVALKRIHASGDPRGLIRLRREALVGASLSHPNLVSVYDVRTEADGDVMIVMEYVPGETLRDRILKRGGLAPEEAVRILEGVAAGLDAIHDRGIVHRDVKPANILLGDDGAVKLADLGVAAVADRTHITTAGGVVGSFSYMAPEQLEAESSNRAMDVYALAAVAFEMLSGHKARPEKNPLALAHAMSTRPAPDLRDRWAQAPPAAAAALQAGMASDPKLRPATAGELVRQLRAGLGRGSARAEAAGASSPRNAEARGTPPALRPAPARPKSPNGGRAKRSPLLAPAAAALGRDGPSQPPLKPARGVKDGSGINRAAARAPRRSSRLAPALIALAALIIAGVVIAGLSSGGNSNHGRIQAAASAHRRSGRRSNHTAKKSATGSANPSTAGQAGSAAASSSSGGTATSTSGGASGPAVPAAGQSTLNAASGGATPAAAVQSFYEDAAHHDYAAAWNLAGANLRNQLGGFASFQTQMSSVHAITFHRTQTFASSSPSSATVSITTTSVQADKTQQCAGTVRTVRTTSGHWLLDRISINCSGA